jgi:glyoxylase-like metal-dependent hydrolase (beta-lactamase superfamily II)
LKVAEDIHRLTVPMERNPLGKTYSYLFTESNTLIDTGVPTDSAYQGLTEELKRHGMRPQDVKKVILTHLHNDHIGLAKTLQEYGAEIVASQVAAEKQEAVRRQQENFFELTVDETMLFGGEEYLQYLQRYRRAFRDFPEPLVIDRTLRDGEIIELNGKKMTVIWTPGHAHEHIVVHDPVDRLLFSGDHVLPKITSHVALHSYEDRDPLNDYLKSLDKVKDLDVDTVYPAHEWEFSNLADRVEQLNLHHRNRLREMKDTLLDGLRTVYDIGSRVHWESRPWPEMSFWTKRMAATETYAHLVYLTNKGEVAETKKDGILYYSLV